MNSVIDTVKENEREYSQGEQRPLRSYAGTLAVYGVAVGGAALVARLTGRRAPRLGLWDVALMAVTTHKASRTLAKDSVTSPLRAPFTRYKGTAGPAELAEEVRGKGVKHAIGELITCPFCMAQWIGTAYAVGMTFAPDATRLAGATMTAVAGADWLQLAYARLQKAAEG
ncbi:DUF1360 domain-containing protein [Actinoallomurus soli]|uniref:DUF1360 domain-containing protein n=1 Tax=Actinoallomurus soli TaxID=2952535 RepID=UPI002092B445|nr:DUF1360 domain-containing protein [Actinoallomurus soli]MCO5969693.1 DUF1360 domain-containing protein [Actinoallomurus soli]